MNSLCETMSIHFVEKRVLYTFRSSEFLDKLKNWLTSGRGLVVATCIKAVLYGNLKQTNSFLSKYGLAYITPGWSGSAELSPKMNLFTWAHFGKTFFNFQLIPARRSDASVSHSVCIGPSQTQNQMAKDLGHFDRLCKEAGAPTNKGSSFFEGLKNNFH